MTRHVLIGAGGSGQHVVHAYLKLLALSFPSPELVPHVFIVDADATKGGASGKRSTLMEDIQSLHASLTRGIEDQALCEVIEPHAGGSGADVTLGRLIGIADAPKLQPLAHAFLADDADEWGNDWGIELSKGMMANPKVGSLAMAHKVASETGAVTGKMSQLGELFGLLGPDVRVAIVGSNFGGTGSGVIPTLVREIDQRAESVRAFLTLPWFAINPSRRQAGDRTPSAALEVDGIDPKQRNSSLGLHTYFDEIAGLDAGRRKVSRAAYVLTQSMPHWLPASREDDGNFDQREHKHVLNLLQACAVQSFLGMGTGGAPNKFLYGAKTTQASEQHGRFDAASSPHLRFWAGKHDSRQLTDLVDDAEATAFVLDRAGSILEATRHGAFAPPGNATFHAEPDFDRFVENLMRASGLEFAEHGALWWKKRYVPDKVYADLGKAMRDCASEIRKWLVWIDAHTVEAAGREASRAAGVVGCNRAHLFETHDGGSIPDDKAADRWQRLGVQIETDTRDKLAKSPVAAQALMVLMRPFKPKKDDTDVAPLGKQAFDEQRKRESDRDVASVAARLIAQVLHSHIVALRTTRDDDYSDDEQQRDRGKNDTNAGLGLPILMFDHLKGDLIDDARLVRIDLDRLAKEDQDYLSWSHPLTRACLDPYAGLELGRDGRLDLAALLEIEHPLRGIPNIAAPQLVQRWRLEKCRPRRTADETAPAYIEIDGAFRTQEPGIFLHARRVIEAALWLIVKADRRVVFVDNLLGRKGDASPFERLVRKELDIGDGRLAALVFAPSEKFPGRPVFVWDGSTWFLAANSAAREFFRSLLPQLPTVRRCYRADNILARLAQPGTGEEEGTYKYFAGELHAAVRGLHGIDDPILASLRTALRATLAELPAVDGTAENLHRGQAYDLWLKSGAVAAPRLSIAPHRMLSEANDYVCTPAVVFYADSDGNATPRWNGLIPFRAQAWEAIDSSPDLSHLDARLTLEKIDPHEATRRIDKYTLALRRVLSWELDLKGSGKSTLADPFGTEPLTAVQQELSWSFGIWPNFIANEWNYYIISGTAQIGRKADVELPWLNPKLPVALVVWGRAKDAPDGDLVKLGQIVNGLAVRIEGKPEVLEIVVDGKVLGSRRIKLRKLGDGDRVDMIGIDFGTSNSCVAVQERFNDPSSRHVVPLVPGGVFRNESRVEPLLHFMSSADTSSAQNDFRFQQAVFFHVKNATIKEGAGATLPSELLVSLDDRVNEAKLQKPELPRIYEDGALPLHDTGGLAKPVMVGGFPLASPLLTPLAPQPYGLEEAPEFFGWLRDIVEGDDRRLFGDLKWPRPGDKGNYLESRSLRAIYLEHTIVAALAVLRSKGIARFDRFVATQPEALVRLKNKFADTFADDLGRIVRALAQRTGMGVDTDSSEPYGIRIVSETDAALRMVGLDAQHSKKSTLTIDIGGGTTDVGVSLRFGGNGATRQERFTASAPFAGNRLLEAIAKTGDAREWFLRMFGRTEKYSVDVAMPLIKANLRAGGSIPNGPIPAFLTKMFFDAIYEYAFNILRMFIEVNSNWQRQFLADPAQRIKVVLLGNGFKLYTMFQEEGAARTLREYNRDVLERLVEAGALDRDIAGRIDFDVRETGKTGLIADGGFDAADDDKNNEARPAPSILLPRGLRSSSDDGNTHEANATTLIGADAFRLDWVGLNNVGSDASRTIWFDHDRKRIEESFPLTHAYWNGAVDDFDNVFRASKSLSEQYMDAGALYLVGVPQAAAHSFVRLLGEHADKPA